MYTTQTFQHIQYHELQRARQKIRDNSDFQENRIRYILKQCSKEELASIVIRKDKLRRKYTEMVHIYELIHVVSVDLFRWINNFITNETNTSTHSGDDIQYTINEKITELETLRNYVNEQLGQISVSYNQSVPQFESMTWRMSNKKFSLKAAKAKAKAKKTTNLKIGNNEFTDGASSAVST